MQKCRSGSAVGAGAFRRGTYAPLCDAVLEHIFISKFLFSRAQGSRRIIEQAYVS